MQATPDTSDTAAAEGTATDRGLVVCWSCKGPVPAGEPFCASCKAVQPPGQLDHFARLGLPQGFDVDPARLERAYFDRQRMLHPDRFATKTPREKALSQQQATSLNDAYETLKDPLQRATYLAGLLGLNVLREGCNALTDPVILMEAMEMREALAEAETADAVAEITDRAVQDIRDCEDALAKGFEARDMDEVSHLITRLKYLRKLADETRFRRAQLRGGG